MAHSTIELAARPSRHDRIIYTGWNDALETFYARVLDLPIGGDPVTVFEVGRGLAEVDRPETIVESLRPYCDLPDNLDELLLAAQNHPVDTYTDMRADSTVFREQSEREGRRSRMYRAQGYVTCLERCDIEPMLNTHGWHPCDLGVVDGGHIETYVRGAQSMTLSWAWPDDVDDAIRLVSPVTIDGQAHGFHALTALAEVVRPGAPHDGDLNAAGPTGPDGAGPDAAGDAAEQAPGRGGDGDDGFDTGPGRRP